MVSNLTKVFQASGKVRLWTQISRSGIHALNAYIIPGPNTYELVFKGTHPGTGLTAEI